VLVAALFFTVAGVGSTAVLAADNPAITAANSDQITISVSDSANGNDTATVPVTVTNESSVPADAVYESGSAAAEYDSNTDGRISISELGAAGGAYAQGTISIAELGNVGGAYAAS